MKSLTKRVDARTTYVDLMCRIFFVGVVQIHDEQEHAYCAGFTGKRGVKSWRERMKVLKDLGFIYYRPHLQREIGFVLVRDPHIVASELFDKGLTSDEWWAAFQDKMNQFGARFGAGEPGEDEELAAQSLKPAPSPSSKSHSTPEDDTTPF